MVNSIINGDSCYVLDKLPDNFIDLVITSPPYNASHDYDNYDDNKELDEYLLFIKNVFGKTYRKLKDDGKVCLNVPFAIKNMKTKKVFFLATKIAGILNDIGFQDFEMITWHKGENIKHFQGNNTAWGSWKSPSCPNCRPMCESIMIFYKKERKHFGDVKNIDITSDEFKTFTKNSWYTESDGFIYKDITCVPNKTKKEVHPAPYPVELIERIIKMYSYKDDIILDPFNGIGTTTLAAANLGRQYIGIELSDKYCKYALERMEKFSPSYFIYDDKYSGLVNSNESKNTLNFYFPYKESFSPNFLSSIISTELKIKSIYDPFMGTGSSFMSPAANTANCIGCDTNPLSIEITKAKLITLSNESIDKIKNSCLSFCEKNVQSYEYPDWEPFSKYANKEKYDILKSFIEYFSSLSEDEYRFVKYLIISNLQMFFDYKRDGNGIKYRKSNISINSMIQELKRLLSDALNVKRQFDINNKRLLNLNLSTSMNFMVNEPVDCVLTSPPYCNMFDYFEIYKMELWTSELIKSYDEWRALKKTAMRNNKNSAINKDSVESLLLKKQIEELEKANEDRTTIDMINNYFYDFDTLLKKVFGFIKKGGHFFIVVGNSFYSGIPIMTDEIIMELAIQNGYRVNKTVVARRLSTSSQQLAILKEKDKIYLRESILDLERI